MIIRSKYSVYQKNLYLLKFKLSASYCISWQLWLLRINDPQKQKVLYMYTLEINKNVI